MRKKTLLIVLAIVTGFIFGCRKHDDDNNQPAQKYDVNYTLEITGNHSDLVIKYNNQNSQEQQVTNPAVPWNITISDFESGDKAYLYYSVKGLQSDTFRLHAQVDILKGSGIVGQNDTTFTIAPLPIEQTFTWHWEYTIN